MKPSRSGPFVILICLVASLQLPAAAQSDQSGFGLRRHRIEIPELGFVDGFQLITVSNRFEFVQPKGFIVRTDAKQRRVSLSSSDGRCRIELRLSTNFTGELPALGVLRSHTTNNFPLLREARLVRERHAYTGCGRGHAFDFVRSFNGVDVALRRLYVPTPDWCVVFTISIVAADQAKYRHPVGDFLSSFVRESRD